MAEIATATTITNRLAKCLPVIATMVVEFSVVGGAAAAVFAVAGVAVIVVVANNFFPFVRHFLLLLDIQFVPSVFR